MCADGRFDAFLTNVEGHSNRTMKHRKVVAILLGAASARGLQQEFLDSVFHATFVVKTREVMKRVGAGGEGFDTLSAQFGEGIERVRTLLLMVLKEEPGAIKAEVIRKFLTMEQDGLERLLELMGDLALIKHWEVDGQEMPFRSDERPEADAVTDTKPAHLPLRTIVRMARLALVLLGLLFIIDTPFTILGWVIGLLVAGLLVGIQYEGGIAQKEVK